MAISSPERRCVDCGVDISGRGVGAKRCEEHVAAWGLECHRKYYAANSEKHNERKRKYRAANPGKRREQARKHYAANLDKCREKARKHRALNPDKARENERRILRQWRAANPGRLREQRERAKRLLAADLDRLREKKERAKRRRDEVALARALARALRTEEKERRYRELKERRNMEHEKRRAGAKERAAQTKKIYWLRHPDRKREKKQRFRARRRNQLGVVSRDIIPRLLASQLYRCVACGTDIHPPQPYHLDHIFPIARGGMHDDSNLQCLCPPCNISKGAKLPAEWKAACAA